MPLTLLSPSSLPPLTLISPSSHPPPPIQLNPRSRLWTPQQLDQRQRGCGETRARSLWPATTRSQGGNAAALFISLFIWSFFCEEICSPAAHRWKVKRQRAGGRGQAGRRTNSGADATPHSASQSHCGEVGSGGATIICEAPPAPTLRFPHRPFFKTQSWPFRVQCWPNGDDG